jgi:hypothetical protein
MRLEASLVTLTQASSSPSLPLFIRNGEELVEVC